MGNSSSVPALSEAPIPPPMFVPDNIEQPKVTVVNPGPFDQLHAPASGIFPQTFEGATITINKPLNNYSNITHNLALNNDPKSSGYTFGSTYVHANGDKPSLVLAGSITPSGNVTGNIIGVVNDNTKCKATFREVEGNFAAEFSADYSGNDYVASAKIADLDPIKQSGIGLLQYLQSCGQRLALGAELMFGRHENVPGKHHACFGVGGRYKGDDWTLAGNVNPVVAGLKLSGCKRVNENVELAAQFEGSLATQECSAGIGYKYSLPERNTVFKGSINSDLVVMATMEKGLDQMPCTFSLSGIADQKKDRYGFGIGLTFG